jgi:hypothetical protein
MYTTIQYNITRLDRIKKINRHKNGTVTTEKYLEFQKFDVYLDPQRIRVPEKSSSLVSAILNPNFAEILRKFHEILLLTLELNPKEQI